MWRAVVGHAGGEGGERVLCFVVCLGFFPILGSFELTAGSGVALWSCPMGGEQGGQVQACFQPHRVPAVFSFNNCAGCALCLPLLSPPCFADRPSCYQGLNTAPRGAC